MYTKLFTQFANYSVISNETSDRFCAGGSHMISWKTSKNKDIHVLACIILHSPRSGFVRPHFNHCYDSANSGCFVERGRCDQHAKITQHKQKDRESYQRLATTNRWTRSGKSRNNHSGETVPSTAWCSRFIHFIPSICGVEKGTTCLSWKIGWPVDNYWNSFNKSYSLYLGIVYHQK
jgi:hypothetical protein